MDEYSEKIMEYVKNATAMEAQAVAQLLLDMRRQDKEDIESSIKAAQQANKSKRISVTVCVLAIVAMLITCAVFCALASGIEITTTTTTETITQDTGEGSGDNIYLSGDNAVYTEGSDGTTDSNA